MVVVREGAGWQHKWLEGLITAAETSFFGGCGAHQSRRRNERNVFCLRCCESMCGHCVPAHSSHPLLQVRRYVYHDVVRLCDLEKLLHCSNIQAYTINGAKVIFLKKRTSASASASSNNNTNNNNNNNNNSCFCCYRILQSPFRFCSLSCKVEWSASQGVDASRILNRFDESDFGEFAVNSNNNSSNSCNNNNSSRRKPAAPHRAPLS